MVPLIIYQAPWDWNFLWNRAQPLASALSAHGTVVYVNCGVENGGRLASVVRRTPRVRSWIYRNVHWGSAEEVGKRLFVYHWHSVESDSWYVANGDRPGASYRFLSRFIDGLKAGHDEVWLLTSRPQAERLERMRRWDRVLVDLEDPWFDLSWGRGANREVLLPAIRGADVAFANGPKISHDYSGLAGRPVLNLPNGVDDKFLEALSRKNDEPSFFQKRTAGTVRAVFTGYVNDRIDFDLLGKVARAANTELYLIGKEDVPERGRKAWSEIKALSNVFCVQPRPHSEVPSILQGADVLLLPYQHCGSEAMFPAKLFEYIATGKPILLTLDFGLGADVPPSLRLCRSAECMVDALGQAASGKWVVGGAGVEECRRRASANRWGARAKQLIDTVVGAPPRMG